MYNRGSKIRGGDGEWGEWIEQIAREGGSGQEINLER